MANEQHHPDGWLQDGSLLYRLTDDAHPVNRDEINVAMADGSRSMESCTRRAGELLDCIRAGQAALFAAADASELPKVPDSVLCYVHAYGDSRADDDGRSGLRIGELILALRRWAKSIAAPTIQAAPAAVAGPVAYRVLRKRHDGEWVTDGRAWCDGVPTQDLVDDIAPRSDGWRIEYAFAAPAIGAPAAQGGVLPSLFREALAWGMTYGPEIPAHQWEEMRESMVEKFTARAQAKEGA